MKLATSPFLTTLRDKTSDIRDFRDAAFELTLRLAEESYNKLDIVEEEIETPLTTTKGYRFQQDPILVPILRAGLAMLPPFQKVFPSAPVGVIGLKRNEDTKVADLYYFQVPQTKEGQKVVILDPMLATAGTAKRAIEELMKRGVKEGDIHFAGMVASQEGYDDFKKSHPNVEVTVAAIDPVLNEDKFIVPGLGDFGDRYFGTVG